MRSLFVATVKGNDVCRDTMAAPKTFDPEETPLRVSGMMRSSMILSNSGMRRCDT